MPELCYGLLKETVAIAAGKQQAQLRCRACIMGADGGLILTGSGQWVKVQNLRHVPQL
jgi:hypothetical protein